MSSFLQPPEPISAAWLSDVLRASGYLTRGDVVAVEAHSSAAFNSRTSHLSLSYSAAAPPGLERRMVLKRNIDAHWAIEAGVEEVRFYQLVGSLDPAPPTIVPCYAAAYDEASGNSYLLLRDLSSTHAPPLAREQQFSIAEGVPAQHAIEQVVDALAQHHAYWWDHALLRSDTFQVGYWSRNAERFRLYFERRSTAWQSLLDAEAAWFPDDLRRRYQRAFAGLEQHWRHKLLPRFEAMRHLTLVHGDSYLSNFLCPRSAEDTTYLLDWQSPTVDINGYDLANLMATCWTPEQRHTDQRELSILRRYHATLLAHGVSDYDWEQLLDDYRSGLIYWLLVPLQDRYDGSVHDYWWPKMQRLAAAFDDWRCEDLLNK